MNLRRSSRIRRGAVAFEGAIVYPCFFVVLFAFVVGGLGVFHYQMTACLANEAARYAAVRGQNWATDTKTTSPTQQQVFTQCVAPSAVGIDQRRLSLELSVIDGSNGSATAWDSSPKSVSAVSANGIAQTNRVRAVISYEWFPGLFLAGPYWMTATAEQAMEY
jgi:Flp pilus assembly protein TadG